MKRFRQRHRGRGFWRLFLRRALIATIFIVTVFAQSGGYETLTNILPTPLRQALGPTPTAQAHPYQYTPTAKTLVLGTEAARLALTAAANTGVNTGGWQGTLSDDNLHWTVVGTTTGLNAQLDLDSVQLNGANKLLIQTEIDTDANLSLNFQICDWTSTTSVDAAADAQCTGGGWRSLVSQTAANADVVYTGTTAQTFQWHIYDGYWTTGTTGGTAVSTPLTNFVKATTNQVKIRYFTATNSVTNLDIDFLRVIPIVDSVYHPAGFTNLGSGTPVGTYANAMVVGNSAAGQQATTTADAVSLDVPGTAGSIADFYLSFKNVKTYTGMNTIYVKADYRCSATGINHTPKIYNFTTTAWENLAAAAIACSATDATNAWAKNNVTITDYISSGEIRVGWFGSANATTSIRLDFLYIMLGTTNTDSAQCEITWGTGTATNCTNTRDLNGTGTAATFDNTAEDESNTADNDYYALDVDNDATAEEGTAANLNFAVTLPTNAAVVGQHFAGRFAAGTAGATAMTVQMGLRDYSGTPTSVAGTGGWTQVGAASANATLAYTDSLTAMTIALYGNLNNPDDHLDIANNKMNVRLRTTASGTATTNAVTSGDFAMVSLQWIETPAAGGSLSVDIVDSGGTTVASPSVAFGAATFSFSTQTSTGTFGVSAQKIRLSNTTATPTWTLSVAATSGPTTLWTTGSITYDFNSTAANGRLTVNPSVATITPQGGCASTGISLGSSTSFNQGVTDSVTLASASGSTQTGCYWDFTGVGLTQDLPAKQSAGTYTINMTLTAA